MRHRRFNLRLSLLGNLLDRGLEVGIDTAVHFLEVTTAPSASLSAVDGFAAPVKTAAASTGISTSSTSFPLLMKARSAAATT